MKKQLHVIYITGLGDAKASGQKRAIKFWRFYRVQPHFFQMKWADGEAWPVKFERLLKLVDELKSGNNDVAVVAASAGATVAINAFVARPNDITGVVLIAGKANRPEAIGDGYSRKNPALKPAALAAQASFEQLTVSQRERILSRYGIFDELVTREDSFIPGAHNQRVWSAGHFITIATQITFGTPSFLRFLKRLQPNIK